MSCQVPNWLKRELELGKAKGPDHTAYMPQGIVSACEAHTFEWLPRCVLDSSRYLAWHDKVQQVQSRSLRASSLYQIAQISVILPMLRACSGFVYQQIQTRSMCNVAQHGSQGYRSFVLCARTSPNQTVTFSFLWPLCVRSRCGSRMQYSSV